MQYYNWEENRLVFTTKDNYLFDLQFKSNKSVVTGGSGTGKSLLCKYLEGLTKLNASGFGECDNIFLVNVDNLHLLSQQKSKFIIIDRADIILTDDIVDLIRNDHENRYLIFARRPLSLGLSPNHVGEFIRDGNTIRMEYHFNVKRWY